MANYDIRVIFQAIDKLTPTLKKLNAGFGQMNKKWDMAGKRMKEVGRTMTTRISLPLALIGLNAGRVAIGFDDSMRKVQAVTRATGEQFSLLRERALELGAETRFRASEAAEGMTFLAMAGLDVKQVYDAIGPSLQLAAAGGISLAEAADHATNIMTAMSLKVSDLNRINDVLAESAASANLNVLEMAEAMRPVAGTASSMGIELEDLAAMIAKMADSGEKGSIAGTLLRNALLKFIKDGGDVKKFFKELEMLKSKDMSTTQKTIMIQEKFGERGARAIQALLKPGKNLDEFSRQLKNSHGAGKKMAETMEKGIGGAFRKFLSKMETVNIKIGEMLVPILLKLADKLKAVFDWFLKLSPGMQKVIVVSGLIFAALGPVLIILGHVTLALQALIPVMITLTAVAAPWLVKLALIAAALKAIHWIYTKIKGQRETEEKALIAEAGMLSERAKAKRAFENAERLFSGEFFQRQKTELDINLHSDPGTSIDIGSVKKKGKGTDLNIKSGGYSGQTIPIPVR